MSIGPSSGAQNVVGTVAVKVAFDTTDSARQLSADVKKAARDAGQAASSLGTSTRPGRQGLLDLAEKAKQARLEGERVLANSRALDAQMQQTGGGVGTLARQFSGLGIAAIAGYQAINELQDSLRVTGAEASTTQGRFRNFGAELLGGNVLGAIKALRTEFTLGAQALEQLSSEVASADFSNLEKLVEFAEKTGNKKLLAQIQGVQAQVRASSIQDQQTAAGLTEGNLQDDLAAARRIENEAAIGIRVYKKGTAAYSKAFKEYAAAVADRRNVQEQIKNEQKKAADDELERARDKSDGIAQAAANQLTIASLTESLQDDLAAASKIESLYRERVAATLSGTAARTEALNSLASAHAKVESISASIAAEQKRYRDEQARLAKEAAAEAKRQREEAEAEAKRLREEAAAAYRSDQDFAQGQIELSIRRAQLTEKNLNDDKKAQRQLIKFLKQKVKDAKLNREERQQAEAELIDAQLGLRALNKQGKDKDKKKDTVAPGLTAQDFFAEAASQFQQYGSNIAGRNGILSGQDARAALGALGVSKQPVSSPFSQISGGIGALTQVGGNTLTEARKQTALLGGILVAVGTRSAAGVGAGRGGEAMREARSSVVSN